MAQGRAVALPSGTRRATRSNWSRRGSGGCRASGSNIASHGTGSWRLRSNPGWSEPSSSGRRIEHCTTQ